MGLERYTVGSHNNEWKKVAVGAAAGALVGAMLTASFEDKGITTQHESTNKETTQCVAIQALEVPEIINDRPGNLVVRNTDQCIEVHNPNTLKTVGRLLAGEAYNIICFEGPKPASFRIAAATRGLVGDVQLSEDLITKLDEKPYSSIPECPYPAV